MSGGESNGGDQGPAGRFDASPYLVNLNGRGEYLEVKWRLLWLRKEHPNAIIETDLIRLEERDAVFKATVTIPGGGSATGWGSESAGDFRDFLEKAETKAIGRALAALGFGTQFCDDHQFSPPASPAGSGQMRVVDAPVDLARRTPPERPTGQRKYVSEGNPDQGSQRATERQVKFIYAIAREQGLGELELATWSQELYSCEVDQLNRRDASTLIEALQRRRNEVG